MCATCGCSDDSGTKLTDLQTGETIALAEPHHHHHEHEHEHEHHHEHGRHHHDHDHSHSHSHEHRTVVTLEQEVLARNNRMAERVRGWLAGRGILALNLVSSPGAGKTTLLERTIRDLEGELAISVIEGDQQTLTMPGAFRKLAAAWCRSTPGPHATSTPR